MSFDQKAVELGLELDAPQPPSANYLPAVRTGNLVYTSGNGPYENGSVACCGHLGREVSLEAGYAAARLAMVNVLKALKGCLGSLDSIERIVKVTGYVASTEAFQQQPQVINGASDLLVELFGERGRHTRCAIGVASLPKGMAVELDIIVALAEA